MQYAMLESYCALSEVAPVKCLSSLLPPIHLFIDGVLHYKMIPSFLKVNNIGEKFAAEQ